MLEKEIHKKVVSYLRNLQSSQITPPFIFFHVKNDVGFRRGNFFYDLKPLGVLSGVPDFIFLVNKNNIPSAFFLELKTKRGRLSENQKKFILDAKTLGFNCLVSYGLEQALQAVTLILEKQKDKI